MLLRKAISLKLNAAFGLLLGMLVLAAPASLRAEELIRVRNHGNEPIWVTVAFDTKNLVSSESGITVDNQFEAHLKYEKETSLGLEGIEASNKDAIDIGGSTRQYNSSFLNEKFDWSPFIQAGEAQIRPGQTEEFAVSGEKNIYYLSMRRASGILKVNVPKSIHRHNNLVIDDQGYEAPRESPVIHPGRMVFLKSGNEYVTTPHKHGSFGDAVGMHQKGGGVKHMLLKVDGSTGPLKNGDIVFIHVEHKSAYQQGKYFMHHGHVDNIYYTDNVQHNATKWQIIKKRNGRGEDSIIYEGTSFTLGNMEHRDKGLAVGNDGWLHSWNNKSEWSIDLDE